MIKILESAIEYEKKSADLYREGAAAAEDPETRTLFEQLVRWEQDHERMLKDRLATLRMIRGQQ